MILALDVGNTQVTVGLFDGSKVRARWRLATDPKKTADEYGTQLKALLAHAGADGVSGACLASVVPALTPAFTELSERYLGAKALVVDHRTPLGLKLKVDHPAEVGADRIVNALAAWKLFGGPAIVLDFGTATTFDCVSGKGEYLGGAIVVGPRLAARALAAGTAQLPEVELRAPKRAIGRNTIECIQAGLWHGYLGMVSALLKESARELGGRPVVLATGGLSGPYAKELGVRHEPDLSLQGLRLAHEAAARKD